MRKIISFVLLTIVTIMTVAASAGLFSAGFLTSSIITAPSAAQPYIDMGKFYLTSHNILAARDQFKQAVLAEPGNQEANFLCGITRIAAVVEDGQGLNTTGLDSVREIFEQAGVVFSTYGLYGSSYSAPAVLAPTTPRTGAVLDFLKTKLMPEVDGAIANLQTITSTGFTSTINPATFGNASGVVLTADYADALVTKAMLHALKCDLELLMVYGPDVNLPNIQAAPNELMTYKQLFQDSTFLTPKEATRLATARASLINFIDTYSLAAQQLQARSGSAHHLFVVDVPLTDELVTSDMLSLNDFKKALAEIKASLNGPYLYTFAPNLEPNNRFIDLSKLFDANNPINLRIKINELASGAPSATMLNGLFPLGLTGFETQLAMYGDVILGVTGDGPGTPIISGLPDSIMVMDPASPYFPVKPVSIKNTGTAALNISSIGLHGSMSTDFTLDLGTCGSILPFDINPGGSCSVTVDLKHPATGSRMTELLITSNDPLNQTAAVSIMGWVQNGTSPPPLPNYSFNILRNGTGSGAVQYSALMMINNQYNFIQGTCAGTVSCGGSSVESFEMTISSQPDPGSIFAGWSGCDKVNGNECKVRLFEPQTVTATFNRDPKPLIVLASPSGGTYATPPSVSLAASKAASIYYTLDGSEPNATNIKYSAPIIISKIGSTTLKYIAIDPFGIATSVKTENYIYNTDRTLTINSSGSGSGNVTSDTGGVNCSRAGTGTCTKTYPNSSPVTLTVTTASDSTFDGWSGDCTGIAPCILAMASDKNVTAQFGLGPNNLGPVAKVSATGYNTVNDAYSAAGLNATILAAAGIHPVGALYMDQGKNILLKGGYNSLFTNTTGLPTVIQGTLKIDSGNLRIDNVKIRR